MKRLVILGCGVLVLLLATPPASAQYPPPSAAAIDLSDTTLECPSGQTLTITGEGFLPHEPLVRIFFDGTLVADVFPNSSGAFSVTIDPPAAAEGEHLISAQQFVAPEEDDLITVFATLVCVGGAGVAFTGADISTGLILLAALLGVGAAALMGGRRRSGARS
jgi:uncharacterized Zn-binding protein involved in type VI secretion